MALQRYTQLEREAARYQKAGLMDQAEKTSLKADGLRQEAAAARERGLQAAGEAAEERKYAAESKAKADTAEKEKEKLAKAAGNVTVRTLFWDVCLAMVCHWRPVASLQSCNSSAGTCAYIWNGFSTQTRPRPHISH